MINISTCLYIIVILVVPVFSQTSSPTVGPVPTGYDYLLYEYSNGCAAVTTVVAVLNGQCYQLPNALYIQVGCSNADPYADAYIMTTHTSSDCSVIHEIQLLNGQGTNCIPNLNIGIQCRVPIIPPTPTPTHATPTPTPTIAPGFNYLVNYYLSSCTYFWYSRGLNNGQCFQLPDNNYALVYCSNSGSYTVATYQTNACTAGTEIIAFQQYHDASCISALDVGIQCASATVPPTTTPSSASASTATPTPTLTPLAISHSSFTTLQFLGIAFASVFGAFAVVYIAHKVYVWYTSSKHYTKLSLPYQTRT